MNETLKKLQGKGHKFSCRKWPTITVAQLTEAGVTKEEFWKDVHSAALSETMGPNWKIGIMLKAGAGLPRPYAFNNI